MIKQRTREQRQEVYDRWVELRRRGTTVEAASKQVGLGITTIGYWVRGKMVDDRGFANVPRSPSTPQIPTTPSTANRHITKLTLTDEATAIQEGYLELSARITDILPGLKALDLLEEVVKEGGNLNIRMENVIRERDELQGRLTRNAMGVYGS